MRILVNLDVDDLDRAIAFYTDGLGLRMARRILDGSIAEMTGAAVPIYLIAKPAGSAPAPGAAPRDYGRHWTPVHLDFEVDDVPAAVERAVRAGATLEQALTSYAWGELALLADPFGHGFCLLRLRGGYPTA